MCPGLTSRCASEAERPVGLTQLLQGRGFDLGWKVVRLQERLVGFLGRAVLLLRTQGSGAELADGERAAGFMGRKQSRPRRTLIKARGLSGRPGEGNDNVN